MTQHRKQKTLFTALGLLAFFLLCLVPGGSAQDAPLSFVNNPAQLGRRWTFTASSTSTSGFTVQGLTWWQIYFIPSGTIASCALSLDSSTGSGYSTGGIISSSSIGSCASAGSYSNLSGSATTPTLLGQMTPTISGTGSVTVVLFGYVNNPTASGGGGGGGGSNAAASATGSAPPADAGYNGLNVGGTFRGQTGVNPSGAAYAAQTDLSSVNGTPFSLYATLFSAQAATATATGLGVRAPSQSAYGVLTITGASIAGSPSGCQIALEQQQNTGGPVSAAYATQTFTPANSYQSFVIAPAPASAAADTIVPVYSCGTYPSAGTITVTFAALNTVGTQPSGFASLVAAQQAVTASAAALPSNAVHGFCVQALTTNGAVVYIGPSGVTTSTGFPLSPGQIVCYQLLNTNLAYVIAASTGSSVAVTGN